MAQKIYFLLVVILTSFTQIRSETCTFTRTPDTRGLGDGDFAGVMNIDECEEACRIDSACVATYQQDPVCYFALDDRTTFGQGVTHSLKVCTYDTTYEPSTTTVPTTHEPVTAEPTTQGICIMRRKEDKTGGNDVYYKLEFSSANCLELCRVVDDCQSVTIARNSCRFHTDVTTTTTILGSFHYVKTQCNDGRQCCWESKTHTKSDETPAFIFDNTLDSCEALCGKLLRCSGVKWSDNKCYIYVNNPALTPESNSVFSEKICSTGGDVGHLTFSSICSERNEGVRLTTYFLYYFSVSLFSFFKHILR